MSFMRKNIQIIFFLTVFHYYVLIKSINVGNGDPGKLRYRQQIDQLVQAVHILLIDYFKGQHNEWNQTAN